MGRLRLWLTVVAAGILIIAAVMEDSAQEEITAVFASPDGNVSVSLEVADTPEERGTGLMNRTNLSEKRGMLFVFPNEKTRIFWMKNTYIPLDIIFLDADMMVVDIDQAYPQPYAEEDELKRYRSDLPAKYVVELRRGFTERYGIEEGVRVYLGR